MSCLNDDLNDSDLFCKSIIQKRKASGSNNPKSSKQLKLNFPSKADEDSSKDSSTCTGEGSSVSAYFHSKKTTHTCPLCLKSFKADSAYSTHMKQCAKSHKMTTQQLLGALELQKKQMQERRNLGLCTQNIPPAKKPLRKKEDREKDAYDLALGIAISKSLSSEPKAEALVGTQSTLNQFGIKLNPPTGPCRKKNEKKSALKERTAEDRQRIIIEKVAVVLLDEEKGSEPEKKDSSANSALNDQFTGAVNMVSELWNLGENNEKRGWYVPGIKTLVVPTEGEEEKEPEPVVEDNLERQISELNLPREGIHKDWKRLINSSKFSDVRGRTKDRQEYHLHSVVVFARRPEILEKDYKSVLEKYNLSTILVFLEYLYCGTLNGLVRKEVKDLRGLAAELNDMELVDILNCLEKTSEGCEPSGEKANEERSEVENKAGFYEEKDLFVEEDLVDLTQTSHESPPGEDNGSASENESNAEKSYWSFLQHEKERERLEMEEKDDSDQKQRARTPNGEGETDWRKETEDVEMEVKKRQSDDSATRDLDEALEIRSRRGSSDCIVLSSGSESRNLEKSGDGMRTPSPGRVDFEVPYYDPYDNMLWFSEEQFSPVNAQSQSLITGDVSREGSKVGDALRETPKGSVGREEEGSKNPGYCSTPVTVRRSIKVKSSRKSEGSRRRRSDLTGSRILRKSLGLKFRASKGKSTPVQRKSVKRMEKDLVEILTDSILNEMSKSFQSSTPVRAKNFVEITPIPNRDEFGESVTPSPNYSRMEEALLKEHLSKYGLKKNLGKSKARKILRHIYEELHPLYNTKTGKIVKILPSDTPKVKKKAKPKAKTANAPVKPKQRKKKADDKDLNSSRESAISDASTLEGADNETDESDMENFSETLTQTVPSNPVDLPSAFVEFLENNPEYHEKILLYEPIWLEELQKKLKECFKKHFKLADLMDYLDQKCITFRSETQVKNTQRKNEKKKKMAGKAQALPDN